MTVEETAAKIRSLEIQGAESVAIAAVEAFGEKMKETQDLRKIKNAVEILSKARPTEPALRNALKYCIANFEKDPSVAKKVVLHFKEAQKKIVAFGAEKIKNGMTVFTHCHSSTVTAILVRAWKDGKKFEVRQTETRPRLQGRITAKELAEAGIPVTHGVDSAGRFLITKADIFLFGADSVTVEGNVINKIGTTALAEFALDQRVPVYACTNSWKFNPGTIQGIDETIEQRDPKEVWENPPSGVKVVNPAFEEIPARLINGIITELGIYKPETLIWEIQKDYPWLT